MFRWRFLDPEEPAAQPGHPNGPPGPAAGGGGGLSLPGGPSAKAQSCGKVSLK